MLQAWPRTAGSQPAAADFGISPEVFLIILIATAALGVRALPGTQTSLRSLRLLWPVMTDRRPYLAFTSAKERRQIF
ncbi:hypothetical protein ASC80_17190 [Afipia sp. Root123D2]|nr:hypothetical protein ASC80_17190 [Afipia sp. Root123D2]